MQNLLENSIFNFCLHCKAVFADSERKICFGTYVLYFDARTPILQATLDDRELLLFGLAVDVRSGECENLPRIILEATNSLGEVIDYERFLGGKYILLYRENDSCYALPDATASIPFCYSVCGNELVCSSSFSYVASYLNLNVDPVLQKIRVNSDISQAMPYDLTIFREIKQLLPNHYFCFSDQSAVRFVNSNLPQQAITANAAAEITAPRIEAIARFYHSVYPLYCPLTGGRDSRAVLAFLLPIFEGDDLLCYTIRHTEHKDDAQDLTLPKQLAEQIGLNYEQITDEVVAPELCRRMDELCGEGNYSKRTLMIANTVWRHFGNGAIVNGDIIGQVGKCSLHRDIPACLATAGYFRCKLHNYSKEAKSALREWLQEIEASQEKVNPFDLFSIENRLGRWAAQENFIYNCIGQVYLNIFNSRSIIYEWTRVSRAQRKNAAIHLALIRMADPALLSVPFEREKSVFISLSKANGVFYYLSSYLKYLTEKIIFRIHNRR